MVSSNKNRISVLLADDHAVVREGYRRLLERERDIVVVGEAVDAATAYTLFCSLDPQVAVVDISMQGASGIDALRRMLTYRASARILIFSMHEDTIFVRRALQAGAFGYVTKASAPNVLVEAVRTIAAGRKYLSPAIAQELALRDTAGDPVASDGLSPREFEILRLLTQGKPINDIARSMGLSPKTIANHQSAIKRKLGADTAIQLLKAAQQLGLEP